jgi:2,3-bisphosphoglycerate-independent phosphoglycerate mutase
MGNSEVGHLNLGAGRVVYQDITRINLAIADGGFNANEKFIQAMATARRNNGVLHLLGLIGPGGVHALQEHLYALIKMAAAAGVERTAIHGFLDGRDTAPDSGRQYVAELLEFLRDYPQTRLAGLCGRFFAMDRDQRMERIEQAWRALTQGQGLAVADPLAALEQAYAHGEYDEFLRPRIVADNEGAALATLRDGDAAIFYNFRSDRARELSHALADPDFSGFARGAYPRLGAFVTMTQYDEHLAGFAAFPPQDLNNTLAQVISRAGMRQLHMAETEKYAHVTFFFNGGLEEPVKGEDRALIPSPREVSSYDQKPAMSALEVSAELEKRIESDNYDFILVNYANCDMVGHTGVLSAAIAAVETLDQCLARIIPLLLSKGTGTLLTADHGNAEQMLDKDGGPYTAHTVSNPVPLLFIAPEAAKYALRSGRLCDVAPTLLNLLRLPQPPEMTGVCLLRKL